MSDARNLPSLTPESRFLWAYWWLLLVSPPVNLLLAIERSGLGGFLTVPLLIAILLMAPVLIVRSLASATLSRNQKTTCLLLSLAALPLFVLVQGIWSSFGSREAAPSPVLKRALVVATLLWMILAWGARVVLRKHQSRTTG